MRGSEGVLRAVIGGTVGLYSLLGHKEWRFIFPLLPIVHLFSALALVEGWERSQILLATSYSTPVMSKRSSKASNIFDRILMTKFHFGLITFSIIPAIFLTSFHSVGQISVMEELRTAPKSHRSIGGDYQLGRSLAVLMPCHSTPWMSHLHWDQEEEAKSWFLECEPPVLLVSLGDSLRLSSPHDESSY